MKSENLEVAIIGKTVGLRGYVKLHNKSDFPEQFKKDAKFFDKDGNWLIIKNYDKTRGEALFVGFESIEAAKELTNRVIYTTVEQTRKDCKLKRDEFFYFDIIGLKILENGEILGIVDDIEEISSSNLLFIKTSPSLAEQGFAKSFYIPYIDEFITSVDLEKQEISTKNAKAILENS
ncbi:16S rRNA processing protein RimM [Campylobacter sp. RM9344]|uniref:Ribosome maturation factor RimM n=1 Tax=Campylobacter californiensis TaxID=1032243 RepID=A0AAW3ZTY3_9BACT|nr:MULTISPECIES: ribosome maturation factor RimM [unclassified Campylobacter]MBE2983968.1 16S rRNA processing protein RimM [Campylobacter sp. RM6883]MBE2994506.1 16S rRNA processing protein RimM [Campylobacter sp. RM6913]MBE3028814.1 16S rRNA processing protein RimM [Campylobacter sp. RM9344]MBE3607703.1 16S rRNA processing protein RimM [Campylobacter sp. RM9337]QCD51095.1 16S rRNA processing protein [Campylobacter sp. RM6914]